MNDTRPTISSKDERLMFIEFCLMYKGEVSRSDITELFEITSASATRDIMKYSKESQNLNCVFDEKTKSHIIKDDTFSPLFNLNDYDVLVWLKKTISKDNYYTTYRFKRINLPKWDSLTALTRAINKNKPVRIKYLSLTTGESDRVVCPHSFFDDGLRVYVRAYDRKRDKFIDLSASRIKESIFFDGNIMPNEKKENDCDWNKVIKLVLAPHPFIKNKETIEFEYKMTRGELSIDIKASCSGYFLRAWSVDCSDNSIMSPNEHHLILKNASQLRGVNSIELFAPK